MQRVLSARPPSSRESAFTVRTARHTPARKRPTGNSRFARVFRCQDARWLRELDLNQRPSGYEPDELPDCSIPRQHLCRRSEYATFRRIAADGLPKAFTLEV